MAHQIFSTKNPGTSALTANTKRPLMTKRNRPNVTILMGSVRRTSNGLTNALIAPNTIATRKIVK